MEDLTGKQLGPYQLIAALGEGGMAVVYKAYQPSMERNVALKILPRSYADDPNFVRRFKQEAKLIASLEHPNILPVYDYGEADGYTYIVMRFVEEGKTLADLLQGKPLPLPQIREVLSKLADALDYAHSRGIVHRDIKPSNVLIDQQGHVLLSDFGLAKIFLASVPPEKITTSGAFIGTPTYASPEQCLGRDDLDGRSDVYSLGVMLYEMATGRPPFDADTPMAVVIKQINDPLPLPRRINPALPESVERVILKALAKEPEGRYRTTGEMAKAFSAAVTSAAKLGATMPEPVKVAAPKPRKKRSALIWGGVAGCLVVVALLAVAIGLGVKAFPSLFGPTKQPELLSSVSTATLQESTLTPKTNSPTETANAPSTQTAKRELSAEDFKAIFSEDFEGYPAGAISAAANTPWIQAESGRVGNVTSYWVHTGGKNLQMNSFVYNTEIDYVMLDLEAHPAQLNLELWYTPDGYFIYTDFAQIGLGYVASKFEMEKVAYFWAVDHEVFFQASGMPIKVVIFNELEYARGPADMGMGTPKHNYVRLEFDFQNNEVRFYIGNDKDAPLRGSVVINGSLEFNAFFIAGGLNPTYIDDIEIEAASIPAP